MSTLSGLEYRTLTWIRKNPGQSGSRVEKGLKAEGETASGQYINQALSSLEHKKLIDREVLPDGRKLNTITALGEFTWAQSSGVLRGRSRTAGT